ncbi:pentapeptide repeat-containing protein [Actinokineospora soli]|uniref:Pentapeptide repeat-containing protein n=1 Tax=Actinokineospora soli TaxID=1048753 RepID=A0ABW2TQ96_9PSEU
MPVAGARRARPGLRTASRPRSREGSRTNWTTVAALLTALAVAGATVFTGISLSATRHQISVTEQGQYTDRFTKAVDQLDRTGPQHLQARLGGIYALERLARDSPRDQPTILEVLAAFIRTTSPSNTDLESSPHITADTQAALTVLARRNPDHDYNTVINLRGANLRSADLRAADLRGANLSEANLVEANLHEAKLSGANLREANLQAAKLRGADLSRANLREANLQAAVLHGTDLNWTDLVEANLRGADLNSANLGNTILSRADMSDAILAYANFVEANLTEANLTAAILVGAQLLNANLSGVDLSAADLKGADLRGRT